MEKMDIMELPNRETLYFYKNINQWIDREKVVDSEKRIYKVIFKKDTPVDVINYFLICRPKLKINYSSEYEVEK